MDGSARVLAGGDDDVVLLRGDARAFDDADATRERAFKRF